MLSQENDLVFQQACLEHVEGLSHLSTPSSRASRRASVGSAAHGLQGATFRPTARPFVC
jgi:hypothetical protein